jgi:hypothetical protein
MGTYYANEAAFDLPDLGFVDRTINVLEATTDAGEIGMFVHRSSLPPGKSLRQIMTEQLAQEHRALAAHAILFEREATVAGSPAFQVGTQWRGKKIMVYQHLAFVALHDVWLLIGVNAPVERSDAADAVMDHILRTFKARE